MHKRNFYFSVTQLLKDKNDYSVEEIARMLNLDYQVAHSIVNDVATHKVISIDHLLEPSSQ